MLVLNGLSSLWSAVRDYEPINQQLEFKVASDVPVRKCVNVSISEDELAEEEEIFHVVLSTEDPNVAISFSIAMITIMDNDSEYNSVTGSICGGQLKLDLFTISLD